MPQSAVQVLRCPSCGAPADSDASACAYCRARLATIGCPSCFGRLFDGAAFCQHCGAARSRAQAGPEIHVKCPACQGDTAWVHVGDIDLLECGACEGTWVEAATFERICANRESQGAILHTSREPAPPGTFSRPVRYRPCPQCRTMMNRINFARTSGAVVDVCRGHGTFLDRGELHQIVRFIQSGGMDRARATELQQLTEERRRLESARLGPRPTLPDTSASRWDDGALQQLWRALRG